MGSAMVQRQSLYQNIKFKIEAIIFCITLLIVNHKGFKGKIL